MNDASSDATKRIALASSSERPRRAIGTVETRAGLPFRAAGKAIEHSRLGRPRCYRINANARPGDFERRGFGEPLDGVLAGGIDRGAGGASMAIGRGDIDDGAAALSEHHPQLHASC